MKIVLVVLLLTAFSQSSFCQTPKISVDVAGLYSIPKGNFHGRYIYQGNAAPGYGSTIRTYYLVVPKVSLGFQTGVLTFGTNDKNNLPLTYRFIPFNIIARIDLYRSIVTPYVAIGGGTSYATVNLDWDGYSKSDSRRINNTFGLIGISYFITKSMFCFIEYARFKAYTDGKTFEYKEKEPTGDIFDIPIIRLKPSFDSRFTSMFLGIGINI